MDRKEFFGKAFTLAVGKGLEVLLDNPVIKSLEDLAQDPKLRQRPPGAAPESDFLEKCTGCDACMIACPVNIIMIEDLNTRLPVIFPEEGPCIKCDGFPCIQACPTGALHITNGNSLRTI